MKNAPIFLALLMACAATADDGTGTGNDVVWLGFSPSVHLALLANCSGNPPPPFPGESCVVLRPQPALTNYKIFDPNASFTVQGNATHSLLCLTVKPSGTFNYHNLMPTRMIGAQFSARALLRLENPVLDDPTLINPVTGKPFNGAIELPSLLHSEVRSLDPNEMFGFAIRSPGHCDVRLTKFALRNGFGLPEHETDEFFAVPSTIKMGFQGTAAGLLDARFTYRIEAYGDRAPDLSR